MRLDPERDGDSSETKHSGFFCGAALGRGVADTEAVEQCVDEGAPDLAQEFWKDGALTSFRK